MTVSFAVQFNSIIKYFFPDNSQIKFPRTKIDIEIYIRFIERFHSLPQHAKIKLIKFERIHRRTIDPENVVIEEEYYIFSSLHFQLFIYLFVSRPSYHELVHVYRISCSKPKREGSRRGLSILRYPLTRTSVRDSVRGSATIGVYDFLARRFTNTEEG